MTEANDVLFGSGAPSFKFENFGDTAHGEIVKLSANQQTDFKTNEPKFWPNGDKMMQVIVTLATTDRDPTILDDEGKRRVFIKGKNLTDGTRNAVRSAGAKGLEIGGTLTVTYVGDGPKERGMNPPKVYEVSYVRPTGNAAVDAALSGPQGNAYRETPAEPARPAQVSSGQTNSTPAATENPWAVASMDELPEEAKAMLARMMSQQQGGSS